jgi:hypothetical protein
MGGLSMKYTLFVIDGGYLDDANDTVTIQGVRECELPALLRLFTAGKNNFDVVVRRSEEE